MATVGTVIGGGAAIGSLFGGFMAVVSRRPRGEELEIAAFAALMGATGAASVLLIEEVAGL